MKKVAFFFILSLFFSGCTNEKIDYPIIIAQEYGVDQFDSIKSIEFEFNVQIQDKTVNRNWKWFPPSNDVIYYEGTDSTEFVHSNTVSEEFIGLDKKFINDSYWLLFPLHLKWDKGNYSYSVVEGVESPINHVKSNKLIIQYINNGGYTPNDIYELFINENNRIVEWIYRKEGSKKPTKTVTWERTENIKGLKIATFHTDEAEEFMLSFENIEIK